MTKKFDAFISDLDQLCKKHDAAVNSSLYDPVAVFDGYDSDAVAMIWDETDIRDEVGESLNPSSCCSNQSGVSIPNNGNRAAADCGQSGE